MEKGTHGMDEKAFEDLSYADQARAINATILQVERAIKAHLKLAKERGNFTETVKAYENQLLRVIETMKDYK